MAEHDLTTVEVWKPVLGFEGYYEVSSIGRVRSLDRVVNQRPGCTRMAYGRILVQLPNEGGYLYVGLSKEAKVKHFGVHQLVAAAFIGPCPEGLLVNHIDFDRKNNVPKNLEYATYLENAQHSQAAGRFKHGVDHWQAKLTPDTVRECRRLRASGMSYNAIGRQIGVSRQTANDACTGKLWHRVE